MSSAEFRPYKSRLFNLISDNYQKVSDAGSRTWRYVKFAASFTVQTALYPLYVIMQTVRVTAKQLGTAVKQRLPQLQNSVNPHPPTPPHVDTPIHRVLKAATQEAETLLSINTPSEQPENLVQGIASLIETQKIVLVNPDNQILDVLSASQQQRLQQRMILEVADYYRFQNRLVKQQEPFHVELYPLANQREILSPIRWFWQVMAWVQISPVAVKVNLFGESRLVATFPPQQQAANSNQGTLPYPQFFCSLDGTIAQVEEYSIFPWVKQNQALEKNPVQGLDKTKAENNYSLESSEDAYFYKIQTLILAAVDYFFGGRQPQDLLEDAAESLPASYTVDDPWGTEGKSDPKLSYKQRTEQQIKSEQPFQLNRQPTSTTVPVLPKGNTEETIGIWHKIKASFVGVKTAKMTSEKAALSVQPELGEFGSLKISPVTLTKQPKSVKQSNNIVAAPSQKTAIATAIATPSTSQSKSYPEAKPEWLEAKVTSTGYVKHPLERILGWLDQIMVGLEEAIFKVWYWLTHYQK